MENSYSITVANKFSLSIDEDEDPLELLKVREQEKEAKKKEKLSEKENKSKLPESVKTSSSIKPPKPRVIKENQQTQPPKVQEAKKESGEKKPVQQRSGGGDRNVKFSGESREERNNRRNREDGERPPRNHDTQVRRGPLSGEGRDNREFRTSGDGPRGDFGDRRGPRGSGSRSERGDRSERGATGSRGGGPRGGGRGGARTGFDSRGKREFDRQSGSDKTGVKPVDKKDGAGSHNWGTHNDEIEESMNAETQDWNAEKPETEAKTILAVEGKEGEAPREGVADASADEKPAEEEAKELTFDEWKALRGTRAKPTYNLRKAGEGEDLTRWKKMYALEKKKEGTEEDDEDEDEYDVTVEYPQRVGRQKRVFDIEIQFSDSRRGGGGRGGRVGRGSRGDRPNGRGFNRDSNRGPPRDPPVAESRGPVDAPKVAPPQVEQKSPRGRQNAPKVDDEHDFPSLG